MRGNQNGMVVADSDYDSFCTNEKTWAWLTKGGERNALDDFCDSVGPVVTWFGEWLRGWRVHSYSACDCTGGAAYQHNRRTTSGRIGKRTLFALLDARHVRAKRLDVGRLDI